jgi:23S rRNA pseudouridine1911/1915/1917 synthase
VNLVVLYEDADLVAVSKPAGIPSHPLRPGEGGTLAEALVARYPECARASIDPREGGLGHRLDRGTSGVLVAARHPEAWRRLRQALAAPGCEKLYLAEVVGEPQPGSLLSLPSVHRIADDRWSVTAAIGRIGRSGARVKLDGGRNPLDARTEVHLLERRGATALVEARLSKGRAHQVRAHLAYLGTPVVGDVLYGRDPENTELHLHAAVLTLHHPTTGRPLRLEAPIPPWGSPRAP